MGPIEIRRGTPADAGVIAAVNLACWRETYEGSAPAELMATLSLEERVRHWSAIFSGASPQTVFLAFAEDGSPTGFSSSRPHADILGRLGHGGEISAIYLLQRAQRRGVGRRLMSVTAEDMWARGMKWASLCVLRDNLPARRFYEALGGRRIGASKLSRGVPQIVYGWRDVRRLILPHRQDEIAPRTAGRGPGLVGRGSHERNRHQMRDSS